MVAGLTHIKIRDCPPRQLCSNMKNTNTFKCKHSNKIYQINKNSNRNFKMVIYLIECSVSGEQDNGSNMKIFFLLEPITINKI